MQMTSLALRCCILSSFGCQADGEVQAGVDQAAGGRRADGDEAAMTKKQKRATWRNCHGTRVIFFYFPVDGPGRGGIDQGYSAT